VAKWADLNASRQTAWANSPFFLANILLVANVENALELREVGERMGQAPEPAQSPKGFDPFAADPRPQTSTSWMWATAGQAAATSVLLILFKLCEGHPREKHLRIILMIGIAATWCLALRTIRQRLLELMIHWQKASKGLLRKASESGKHWIATPLNRRQEEYIKGSIWRLRIIAAGLTIPFFVMPFVWSFVSLFVSLHIGPKAENFWAGMALFMMVSAVIVAGYFHWAIVPLRAAATPVRVFGNQHRIFPSRIRRR
jgi:hypothetical protein